MSDELCVLTITYSDKDHIHYDVRFGRAMRIGYVEISNTYFALANSREAATQIVKNILII